MAEDPRRALKNWNRHIAKGVVLFCALIAASMFMWRGAAATGFPLLWAFLPGVMGCSGVVMWCLVFSLRRRRAVLRRIAELEEDAP
jgi:hypothetical protein